MDQATLRTSDPLKPIKSIFKYSKAPLEREMEEPELTDLTSKLPQDNALIW